MTQQKIKELKQSLNSEFQLIHELCLYVLSASQRAELIRATMATLHAFLSWIPLGYIFESPLTNCSVASSLGTHFLTQISRIFLDMLNVYRMHSELISTSIAQGGPYASRTSVVKLLRAVKRETLKLIETFLDKAEDQPHIGKQFVPPMMDPVLGDYALNVPDARESEVLSLFATIINKYLMLGDISIKAAHKLALPEVSDFFAKLIQRVSPKSYQQAFAEVFVTQKFLENFCGDQVRFLARSFAVPGNHLGQHSHGFRWPYGPVAIITPFNFPLEIPLLQLMGALYMGNKPVLKVDSKVAIVMEQMLRLLHDCGLPAEDVDFINSDGITMNKFLMEAKPRMTLFTGSSRVAEKLAVDLSGRIRVEDAGFDWKILGPDVQEEDYVAWVCDQDAYACSGQKCSAQSILFVHENWSKSSFLEKLSGLAARRKLDDLTVGPVLTVTTEAMLDHLNKLLKIKGSKLLFGGEALENHSIPAIYGAIKPTAVFVPLEEILKEENYELVTKEIFGPFQVVTEYKQNQLPLVLNALERMHAHLTAAVVSNDPLFIQEIIGNSVNGTTYVGLRARTTGAPQNHWFGPAGDPRAAGIGTPEAIKLVWSSHREVIYDVGPVPQKWATPQPT